VSFVLIAGGIPASLMVLFPDASRIDYDPGPSLTLVHLVGAIHNYAEAHDLQLPPAAVTDKAGRPLYSWRVLLLPYLEEERLFKEFHFDEPWDSEHNKTLIAKMPEAYRSPYYDDPGRKQIGFTFYQVFTGPGTPFERPGLTLKDFPDGLSKTLLVVEADEQVPWTKPADLVYDPAGPLPKLGTKSTRAVVRFHRLVGWQPGYVLSLADGSCRRGPATVDEAVLRAWIVRNHGPKPDL
jgi:hypothetical protein